MTVGIKLGKGTGWAGASIEAAARGALSYTGQFGKDFVQGTKDGYADRKAALATARALALTAKQNPTPAPVPAITVTQAVAS